MNTEHKTKILSVEKAINIINLIAGEENPMTLTEISNLLSYPKSTAHAILSTLKEYSFIEQLESNGKYKLGMRLFELGSIMSRSWNIAELSKPYLRRIMNRYNLSAQIAVISNNQVIYVECENPTSQLRVITDAGNTMPVHSNAFGKAILAYKSRTYVNTVLKNTVMTKFTAHTITTSEEYIKELERVYTNGYAIDNGETKTGMRCIAVPIFDINNEVDYAIGITGLFSKIGSEIFNDVLNALINAAEKISEAAGNKKTAYIAH